MGVRLANNMDSSWMAGHALAAELMLRTGENTGRAIAQAGHTLGAALQGIGDRRRQAQRDSQTDAIRQQELGLREAHLRLDREKENRAALNDLGASIDAQLQELAAGHDGDIQTFMANPQVQELMKQRQSAMTSTVAVESRLAAAPAAVGTNKDRKT